MAQCAHRSARRGHRSLTLSSGVLGGSARYRSPSFCLASRAIGLMTSWRLCCVGCARHEGFSFDRSASGVMNMPIFARYVGIDYSGARTPTASLKGLRVYMAEGDAKPAEVLPPPSPRKYWSRRGVAATTRERMGRARLIPSLWAGSAPEARVSAILAGRPCRILASRMRQLPRGYRGGYTGGYRIPQLFSRFRLNNAAGSTRSACRPEHSSPRL